MTQPTGGPGEGNELSQSQIQNPNLPQGFQITHEMLVDRTIQFFLENYTGSFKCSLKKLQGKVYICAEDGEVITQFPGYPSEEGLKNLEFDFENFNLYGNVFIFDGKSCVISEHENSRIDILQYFLRVHKREKFVKMFSETQYIDWLISNVNDEIEGIISRIDEGIEDQQVRTLMRQKLSQVIQVLNGEIVRLNEQEIFE